MRRVLLSLAAAAALAAPARAETVFTGPVADARLAVGPGAIPVVAYVSGGVLSVATRQPDGSWPAETVSLASTDVELDGLAVSRQGQPTALVRESSGSWLALVTKTGTRWRVRTIRPDTADALIGPAGLALDREQRPVVAYALWLPSRVTYLRLVRTDAKGRLVTSGVTKGGFPSTATLAAAAPVVLPSGAVRVVETYLPAAIEWHTIPGDWQGQFLHASALGVPTGRIAVAANGSAVFSAWTEAYPTLGPPAVVLAVHAGRTYSGVALENATLAALALTPHGAELAANRCVADLVCGALVAGTETDGVAAGYAADAGGGRQLLLDGPGGLAWYRSSAPLGIRVTLAADLHGRVEGAAGGSVELYRENAGGQRALVATVPLAADGTFAAFDPTLGPALPAAYRAVYVDPATGIPYAALLSTPPAPR